MKKIGVFICNYNKADYVVRCVQAIKEQTYPELDIFVIDNASLDDSVERLKAFFGNTITILENKENLGGSGGFGRGIRTALEIGYEYFMLVDNDAFLDKRAVEYLYQYMESHQDTGICGAETLNLQEPDKIQDLGGRIDLEEFQWQGVIGGLIELEGNAILECDYVASCSVMARTEAVRQFGGFPEDNFIYWDDVEWCTKCWQAGYKVVVNGWAKAYHDMSGANIENMFLSYYANRNRYRFFVQYLPEDKLENFFRVIAEEFFSRNYAAIAKEKKGTVLTSWHALDDFFCGRTGKAEEGRIVPYEKGRDRLAELIAAWNSVLLYMPQKRNCDYQGLEKIFRYLMKQKKELKIQVTFHLKREDLSAYDAVLQLCEHVNGVEENILPVIYLDPWMNCILDEMDYQYFCIYKKALDNFLELCKPLFERQVSFLRRERSRGKEGLQYLG